jgi:hypothetical protein
MKVRAMDDDDDSGSTVDPALYKQFKMCLHGMRSRKSYVIRDCTLTVLVTPHSVLTICQSGISECEWHHYSILLLQGPEIHDPGTITIHSITPYNFKLFNINKTYKHVRTFTQVKLLIIDEFSMTGQRQLSRISSAS